MYEVFIQTRSVDARPAVSARLQHRCFFRVLCLRSEGGYSKATNLNLKERICGLESKKEIFEGKVGGEMKG